MPTTPVPNVLQDPGYLHWAPLGTAAPANTVTAGKFSDAWPAAWVNLGATAEGTTFSYSTTVEETRVEEFVDPIKYSTTARSGMAAFALANWTLSNLRRVLNGGTITSTGTAGSELNRYVPPEPGAEVRSMIGWESLDSTVRIIAYQTFQGGDLSMSFQRSPSMATINATFNLEKPLTGPMVEFFTAGTTRA